MLADDLADETFPELDDVPFRTSASTTDTFETYNFSSINCTSTTGMSSLPAINEGRNASQYDFSESSFAPSFIDTSNKQLTFLPPKAPVKKKKSYSCHDLQVPKNNYAHVESKVKKIIENMETTKPRTISRHKSMPLSTQPPIDETFSCEKDPQVLIKELRKKSIKIYELEEKCEEKDERIYGLELERSRTKLTFDKLRIEMHDLKEKLHKKQPTISPQRHVKDSAVQTERAEEEGQEELEATNCIFKNVSHYYYPVNRELTFSDTTALITHSPFNHSRFSDANNASSDNLIPDMSMDDIKVTRTAEQPLATESDERKKSKKLQRFIKLISCVSK